MPLIRVSDFGRAALNTDVQETLLKPGEWTNLFNIDIESGDIRSAWGESPISASAPIDPTYIYVFEGISDTWLIISDGAKIYAYDGSTWTDISPSETATTALQWDDGATIGDGSWDSAPMAWDDAETGNTPVEISGDVWFDVFLGTLIVSSSGGIPCYWLGETGRMQPLPGWPVAWRCRKVVSYGNFLVAIALNDGATEGDKYRVAWSDAAAEGTVPQEWTPTTDNLAGSVQLRDSSGYLTTARILRNDLILYKQDSIYRMYQRGDQFVFGFERIVADHGCDSPYGVDALGDAHFFADRGDLRVFSGQNTQSMATLRVRETLAAAISNESRDKTYVVAYPEREQIWVGVVPAGSQNIETVLIYDLVHNAWTRKHYPGAVAMTLGPFAATKTQNPRTWDDYGTTQWDQAEDSWNGSILEPTEDGIVLGGFDAQTGGTRILYRVDKSDTDYNGGAKLCSAEKRGIVLGDIDRLTTLKAIYPEIEGDAPLLFEVGSQYRVGGNIKWSSARQFRPGIDKRIPLRITGVPTAMRISSTQAGSWRLGAISFELVERGRR